MKKMKSLCSLLLLVFNSSFAQETLQSVTERGSVITSGNESKDFITLEGTYFDNTSKNISWKDMFDITGKIRNIYRAETNTTDFVFSNLYHNGYQTTDLFTLKGNGNVGIGTTSPSAKLEVNGDFKFTSEYNRLVFPVSLGYGGGITGDDGIYKRLTFFHGNSIAFETGSNELSTSNTRLFINETGNIGIGTFNPQSKLAVKGTITSLKVKVTQTGWADYVFDSSYQLTPLSHVETFIKENKRLPEVPSAAEVKKDGLDLGENQVLLLKKIEELTLYIIQQNKEMQEMKKELEVIKMTREDAGGR